MSTNRKPCLKPSPRKGSEMQAVGKGNGLLLTLVPPGASDICLCGSASLPLSLSLSYGMPDLGFFTTSHESLTHLQSYSTALRLINSPVIQWTREGHHPSAASSTSFLHSSHDQLESDDSCKFQLALNTESWEESYSQPTKNHKTSAHTLELTSVPLQLKQFLATVRKYFI